MASMPMKEFLRRVKKAIPQAHWQFDRSQRNGMLYRYMPSHPFAAANGGVEMSGIPSPAFYHTMPEYDFIDLCGKRSRGWRHVVQLLHERGFMSASAASKYFYGWGGRTHKPVPTYKDPRKRLQEELGDVQLEAGVHKDMMAYGSSVSY